TGNVAGSPQYMAPEQMQSLKYVDHRADIWSLGVILYYLMAGQRPFEGDDLMSVWTAIITGPPRRLDTLCPDVPPGLAQLVQRCLERDPDRRVQNVAALARALLPFASARGALSVEYVVRVFTQPPARSP